MKNEPRLLFDLSAYGADVFFNPEFTEVDRILDVRIVPKEPMEEIDVTNNPDIDALLPKVERLRDIVERVCTAQISYYAQQSEK